MINQCANDCKLCVTQADNIPVSRKGGINMVVKMAQNSTFQNFLNIQCFFIHIQHSYVFSIKHLLVSLAPNIIFIGQMEKDIGQGVSRVQYLSTPDQ